MSDETKNNEETTETKPTITIAEKGSAPAGAEATPTITIAEREKTDEP